MGDIRNAYSILPGISTAKRSLERLSSRLEKNTEMDINEAESEDVN